MRNIVSHIKPYATTRSFKKHTILLYQGEAPRAVHVVLDGVVKAYSINAAGEEQIVTFETKDDLFPAPWVFHKASTTLYYYEALTDVEVLTVPRDQFHTLIDESNDLRANLLDYFATSNAGLLMRITSLEQSRAREKIMFTLYYLLFRYGRETTPGIYVVEIKLTHSVIASLIGLTRETTTNELSKLKVQKVLRYSTHQYAIDKAKLERLLGEDSFESLEISR
ncbi:MAG TPA: Crp/Fnr family transcriptional regulator [Patescibacteria group bacterium]|nr:Crp/Fnr family transcriptional regulator [Patescibacteria group bacterium]